jgi:hypothetical protein
VSFAPIILPEVPCESPAALCEGKQNPSVVPSYENNYEPLSSEEEQPESEDESQHEPPESELVSSVHAVEPSSEEEELTLTRLSTTAPRTKPVVSLPSMLLLLVDEESGEEKGAEKGAEKAEEPWPDCAAAPVGSNVCGT